MVKRLTDTDKWRNNWFLELSVKAKAFFLFLCDMCDIAGFYERSDKIISFYLGISLEDIDNITDEIVKSVEYREGVYFIKNFIYYQKNLPINTENNCHVGIINKLNRYHDLFHDLYPLALDAESLKEISPYLGADKPLLRGIGKGKGNGNGKKGVSYNNSNSGIYTPVEKVMRDSGIDYKKGEL